MLQCIANTTTRKLSQESWPCNANLVLEPLATIVTNIPKDTPIHQIFNLLITSAASLVQFQSSRNNITK